MPKERNQCLGISSLTRTRCEKPPIAGSDFCVYHDVEYLAVHQCKATHRLTGVQCESIALSGLSLCEQHAHQVTVPTRVARRQLAGMVPKALQALDQAIEHGDWPTVVRAAQVILDRAGLGPTATLTVENAERDLRDLSDAELEARARRVFDALQRARRAVSPIIEIPATNGDHA